MQVYDSSRRALARVRQTASLGRSGYVVTSDDANLRLSISREPSDDNVFVISRGSETVGTVTKQWGGSLREYFTNSDDFLVMLDDSHAGMELRLVVFTAAIMIDSDHFESAPEARRLLGEIVDGVT
jgi:hypothetical protein